MPPVTDNNTADQQVSEDHLAAAKVFLQQTASQKPAPDSDKATATTQQQQDQKPSATEQTKPAAKSPLAALVKSKEADAPKENATATTATIPEDVTKDIDSLKGPEDNSKTAPDWKKLKDLAREERIKAHNAAQEAAALKKQLEERSKTAPVDEATKARLAELEQANAQLSSRLKVLDLKAHPDFEREFVAPQRAAKQEINSLLQQEEVTGVDIDQLMSLKGKKFNEAISGVLEKLTPFAQQVFSEQVRKYVAAGQAAEQAVAKADEFLKTHQTARMSQTRAAFDSVSKEFHTTIEPIKADEKAPEAVRNATAAYNQGLANLQKEAETIAFGVMDETTVAKVAHEAAHYRFLVQVGIPRLNEIVESELSARDARISELQKEVESLRVARPGVGGGNSVGVDTASGESIGDHLAAARQFLASRSA